LRQYARNVAVESPDGARVVRYVPAAFAQALVGLGRAAVSASNGRVRTIRLIETAASLVRLGEPTGGFTTPPFAVREKLDCGAITWRHHPRSTYPNPT
jgi:hypothetical protein